MKNSVLCYLEESVYKFPKKIALTDGNGDTTFEQWRQKGLCIAREIQARGNRSHVPIFVYLPKSAMTIISFVGVLYSGNYYVPTDVKFPFEKAYSIIQCSNPHLILTTRKYAVKLIDGGVSEEKMLYLEDIDFSKETMDSKQYLENIIDTDLAYVFFTSGSTGVPKGVAITHRSIIDYIDWAADEFSITSDERIANQAPFYFDNSILDIYLCMSRGAHLYIIPEMYFAFTAKLLSYLKENMINFIFWVPSALIGVANSGLLEQIDCSCLKKILFAGEVMPNKYLNHWRKILPEAIYANLYGPTEITDVCIYYIVNRHFKDEDSLPIGRACRNTRIMLLDDKNQLITSEGEIGEICVQGTCLSVGYYNNPEKTAEAFVQNPLNTHYTEKIYRTGDLAHYNEFGEIMFDGRKDFQIKHMGYRIELGEIESALLGMTSILNACCTYDESNKEIVAFCQVSNGLSDVEIKKALLNILPKYMIPAKYYLLPEMPLNDNGKINRKELRRRYIEENKYE